jgi:hypothetical protein
MISAKTINPLLLPRKTLYFSGIPVKCSRFPRIHYCVYFVIHGITILYIGSTGHLYIRWLDHPLKPRLRELEGEVNLYWLQSDSLNYRSLEVELIKQFNPVFNKTHKCEQTTCSTL